MPLLPLLIFATPATLGISIFAYFKLAPEKVALCLMGALAGLAAATTLLYTSTLLLPLGLPSLLMLVTTCFAGTIYFISHPHTLRHLKTIPTDKVALVVLLLTTALTSLLAPKLLWQQTDGLYTGLINAYGDGPWHISNITTFAAGQTFPPQDPIFAGTTLTYPFLVNFFSAALVIGQATLTQSLVWPALFLIPLLLTLLYCFAVQSTQRRGAAILAVIFFVLAGATFGFWRSVADYQSSHQPLITFLLHLPSRDYVGSGADPDGYHWLNPLTALILPQRSFLFGFPLALTIVLLLSTARPQRRHYLTAGVLMGLVPLFHAHTTLAMLPALAALFLLNPNRQWIFFMLPAAVVGSLETSYYYFTATGSVITWSPGWTVQHGTILQLAKHWFKNTGLIIPAIVAAFFFPAPRSTKLLAAAGTLLFIAANLWLFAPWAWDNTKILIYWFIFSLPLLGYFLTSLWSRFRWPLKALLLLLIAFHLASATLDLWKLVLPTAATWRQWDNDSLAIAEAIKRLTPPGAIIATAPIHNSLVNLTGHPLYMGYPGHIWSHGHDPSPREQALRQFYEGKTTILPSPAPQYLVVGPIEHAHYPALIIQPSWKVLSELPGWQLFELPR